MTDIVQRLREKQADMADAIARLDTSEFDTGAMGQIRAEQHDLYREAADEIDRLNRCLQYEQHRAERIGTHWPGCYSGGPQHYECALREIDRLTRENAQLAEFVEAVGGFWGHTKSVLVGPESLAEAINGMAEENLRLTRERDEALAAAAEAHERATHWTAEAARYHGERDEALAEHDDLRGVLMCHGFVPCDIPACNCGSWHPRFGYPERMQEIKDALEEAGHPLSNENGHMLLNALRELIAERDAMAKDAERYRHLRRKVCIVGNEFRLLNTAPTYVAPNAAIELDAVTDAQIEQERSEQKEGR